MLQHNNPKVKSKLTVKFFSPLCGNKASAVLELESAKQTLKAAHHQLQSRENEFGELRPIILEKMMLR